MPKAINNIEEKIFDAAKNLFFKKGFEKVNMKSIAKECNLGVGTLYNYYSNKNDLYMKIVSDSWNETFEKLNLIIYSNIDLKTRLFDSIKVIYDDISSRHGLGGQ